MKFGAHVSISGGIDKAPGRAFDLGCECFQIFTRSPRGGKPSELNENLLDSFLSNCAKHGFADYYVHAPYYVNLSSDNKEVRRSSIEIIKEELKRSSLLGANYVMTHLGSAGNASRSGAVQILASSLREVLEGYECETKLLLENSAGQGGTVGDRFEELAYVIDEVGEPCLGICIDTAHLFASGYDLRTSEELKNMLSELSRVIDISRVKLIHGNDSKVGLGERKDRHEQVGKGKIGERGFRAIVNNPLLRGVDVIVEIPPEKVGEDIKFLKSMREGGA